MNVLVKFPSRERPKLFFETLEKYKSDPLPTFLVSIDYNDATMNTPSIVNRLRDDPRIILRIGHSQNKIQAINDGVRETKWDGLLILAADDLIPQRDDYASRIVQLFTQHFPNGDGVLHLNDGVAKRSLNTIPILDQRYFDRTGRIYDSAYQSVFADNEMQEVSERLGCAKYVDEVIIRHEWVGSHGQRDDLCDRNESFYEVDRKVFESRQLAGFP